MTYTDKILELKEMLDDPRTGLRDSSDTNKTRYGILALFEESIHQAIAEDRERMREKDDLLDDMWGLICNVNGGFVEKEKPEWYEAFLRIRDKYFSSLDKLTDKE